MSTEDRDLFTDGSEKRLNIMQRAFFWSADRLRQTTATQTTATQTSLVELCGKDPPCSELCPASDIKTTATLWLCHE